MVVKWLRKVLKVISIEEFEAYQDTSSKILMDTLLVIND